uniref:Putative radical SAM superfamily protein n=1 Tax=viral metagenome TaxID=1070528 RepID=A0A6M3KXH1_9ZZZZ
MNTEFFWDRMAERADETIKAIKSGTVPDIIRFAVHVTGRCNMRCRYCHDPKNNKVIDRELFRDICRRAGTKGVVHITGGEPMCVPWLEEEIQRQARYTRFAFNSNLLKLPRLETAKALFRVKTSLDDLDAERWNSVVGGPHFNTVVANIKAISRIVKYTSVSFTATHLNAARFKPFIAFCKEQFPDLYSISASFFKGNGELSLTLGDITLLFDAAEDLNEVSKMVFLETHTQQGNYFPENLEIPCYLSMTERLIDEYGREFYCSHLYRDRVEAPGNPGNDPHCITGCNARFRKFNRLVHEATRKECDLWDGY